MTHKEFPEDGPEARQLEALRRADSRLGRWREAKRKGQAEHLRKLFAQRTTGVKVMTQEEVDAAVLAGRKKVRAGLDRQFEKDEEATLDALWGIPKRTPRKGKE